MAAGDDTGSELGSETASEVPKIEYPTHYTFKVMGQALEPQAQPTGFRPFVVALFERLLGQALAAEAVTELPSSRGKYVSVSVTVHLHSEDQRRGIYHALHKERRIVYYL